MAGSRSLTLAVRDQLCQPAPPSGTVNYVGYGLGLTAGKDCEVTFDGRPNPGCGPNFFAVHHGRRSNQLLTGDESMHGVMITLSARANQPFDRIGTHLLDWANGVMTLADKVWAIIFANQWGVDPTPGIMNRANKYLLPGEYTWVEALYPSSMSVPASVREDWFSASGESTVQRQPVRQTAATMPYVGLTIVVELTGAKRLQRTGDMGA